MTPAAKTSPKSMAEIADLLGVTAVSVSNALRNSPLVSKELRDRVHEVVRETGFRPRGYKQRKRHEAAAAPALTPVGRIVVLNSDALSKSDPVAHIIMNSVMKRLSTLGVSFEVLECDDVYARPELLKNCGGVIYYYTFRPNHADVLTGIPQVAIMHEEIDIGPWDGYKPNELMAGKLAAQYLIGQGFTRALLTWERVMAYKPKTHPRLEGFRKQMREAGVTVEEIEYDRNDNPSVYMNQVRSLLTKWDGHCGIFAFCDQVAYHACTVLSLLGFNRQPHHLEVISCDNTYLTQGLQPPLPVVDLHIAEISERAVDGLLWRIANPQSCMQEVVLKPGLIVPNQNVAGVCDKTVKSR